MAQNSWDFATYSVKFAGATLPSTTPTPPPTSPPTATPTPTPSASCKTAWSATTVYTSGDEASYDHHNRKAKWWPRNEAPNGAEWGPWQGEGAC